MDRKERNKKFEEYLHATPAERRKFDLSFLNEPSLPEGLEEEIKRYGKEEMPVVLESDLNDIARHFAEWGVEHTKQKPELVQHPAISYMYDADADRDEQLRQALLALLKSDLIQVAGRGFTKQDLIGWVEKK